MRFVSFTDNGRSVYGPCASGMVRACGADFLARYPDLKSAIAAGALHEATDAAVGDPVATREIEFAPAIPNPGKIFCVGMNYSAHIAEMGREPPEYPTLFVRFPGSLVGQGQSIVRPTASDQYDFEGEFAVIIGRAARHVSAADAFDYIAGYSCFMDGSVRDYQRHTSQFIAGKNFHHSGAFGPALVTADEIPDTDALTIETRVSGEVMQQGTIGDLCFGIGRLIEYLSTICVLEPGDVIATGTPSGVGAARDPQRWLEPGDVVEVEIDRIGTLRNQVVAEA